ncbi:hypothetical protein PC9H_000948 [Pleurotus ostreatus]|uniref:G protein gamma domain-containing protein n=1 Tax=Pleurotus ostreatus TaxID=5322 RepID=A0A8H7DX24_PLEOS|nr:uncharacterized protein PC9H_000948 [Pleurotus ostreatus]KAF7440602.1 hypothetical protein PC9H_000948 [Pleurotus ostreatus]
MNARPHKQSMSELKLRRLTEHNQRLREDLARPRVRVSEASARYRLFGDQWAKAKILMLLQRRDAIAR